MDRKTIIDGLKMTMELCVFDPSTGEEIELHLLNDINRATYDACKGALEILEQLPSAEPHSIKLNQGQSSDTISRQAVLDNITTSINQFGGRYTTEMINMWGLFTQMILQMPSAEPQIIRCKDCIYYDPPHIENNGKRYEYKDMPKEAFDPYQVGVSVEFGINVGGRCCVDYNVGYVEDKRVFVSKDNYCGRAVRMEGRR